MMCPWCICITGETVWPGAKTENKIRVAPHTDLNSRVSSFAAPRGVTRVLTACTRWWKAGKWGRRRRAPRPASGPIEDWPRLPPTSHGHVHQELAEAVRHWQGLPTEQDR